MYSTAILFKYLMEFTNYIYTGIINTFSWCKDINNECPAPFPPFCPQHSKEKDEDKDELKGILIEEQPKEQPKQQPKRKKSETDWDIISDNN